MLLKVLLFPLVLVGGAFMGMFALAGNVFGFLFRMAGGMFSLIMSILMVLAGLSLCAGILGAFFGVPLLLLGIMMVVRGLNFG